MRSLRLLRSSSRGNGSGADECKHPWSLGDAQHSAQGLKHGPFHVRDLVLTLWPQTLKGYSPYAGSLWVVKVLGHYSYLLSDGQKWNLRLLKHYAPPVATWTELLGLPLPEAADNQGTEVVDVREEQGVADGRHHYPTRDRQPLDCSTPGDFRHKKRQDSS